MMNKYSDSKNIDWTKAGIAAGGGGLAGFLFNRYLLGNKSLKSDIIATLLGASLTGGGSAAYDYFTSPENMDKAENIDETEAKRKEAEKTVRDYEEKANLIGSNYNVFTDKGVPGIIARNLTGAGFGTGLMFGAKKAGKAQPIQLTVKIPGKGNAPAKSVTKAISMDKAPGIVNRAIGASVPNLNELSNKEVIDVFKAAKKGTAGKIVFTNSQFDRIGRALAEEAGAPGLASKYTAFAKRTYRNPKIRGAKIAGGLGLVLNVASAANALREWLNWRDSKYEAAKKYLKENGKYKSQF